MSDISTKELNQFEEIEAAILAGRSVETPRTFVKPKNKLLKAPAAQDDEDELNTSVSSEDMNIFRLEVLQRLTEDKLRQIPDGAEMEDDDDPILLARNNAVNGSSSPADQRTRLEVQDAPADVPIDMLSPITETAEPVVSNPNSVSSANSTAPSSPCSPLDVAPFTPTFFTTSPANTLDRKKQRLSIKGREDTDGTLVGEEEDEFPSDPQTSATPRFQTRLGDKSRDFPSQSKSFEHLARGSFTVGHVSVESAKAAGIPIIGTSDPVAEAGLPVVPTAHPVGEASMPVLNAEIRGTTDLPTRASMNVEHSEVFQSRKLSQKETDSSKDLSGFRPLVLSSGGAESIGAATEGVDGRRDSLESSPVHSPAFTRGQRDSARQEAALRSRDMAAQDSPSDVVIFERPLSNSGVREENTALGHSGSQARENAQSSSGIVTRSNKAESYVFDFNDDTVHHYTNGHQAQDFRSYKKNTQDGLPESEVKQNDRRAASFNEDTTDQRFQGSKQDAHIGTYSKNSHVDEQKHSIAGQERASDVKELDSLDGRYRHRHGETPRTSVNSKHLRESDGFSTFRKDASPEKNSGELEGEASAPAVELRRSDGFTTFRKGETAIPSPQFSTAFSQDKKQDDQTDRFSTFAKSAKKRGDSQFVNQDGLHCSHDGNTSERSNLQQAPLVFNASPRPLPSRGGEGEDQTFPRGGEDEQVRISGSSNIMRSRTFRKKPDGQIVDDHDIVTNSSPGYDEETSSSSVDSKGAGQPAVVTNIRGSPEGAGSDNPHRISWTDESTAAARLTTHLSASVDRSVRQQLQVVAGP